jgi:hypothetical protein
MNMVTYQMPMKVLEMVDYTFRIFKRIKWNDITPSEYTEIDQNALKQLELTGVCAPFEKNTSEKRKV